MESQRSGSQEPTTSFILPYEKTDGEMAVQLYELTGRKALDWQQSIIYDILGKNADGKWIHTTFGYEVPRQNGKGEILLIREIYGLAVGERILHTAHRTDTSHKAWERLRDAMDSLHIPYYSIKAKGQEVIEIKNGGKVEFRTRTNAGGLGETFDVLIIDEYEIIGLNLKSQLNQGFRGLVLFLLTLKIADKAIHRRQYAQNRNLSAERGAASLCSASTRHTLPTYISFRRSTELSACVDLHRLPLRHSTHVPVARAA